MFRTLSFLCLFHLINSKGYSGGRSTGYAGNGNSHNPTTRGSQDNNFRRHNYLAYYLVTRPGRRSHSYLYYNKSDDENFDCGNGKKIMQNKVCDWIDDCGNQHDEKVPLPCKGAPSTKEVELYTIIAMLFLIWCIIICILLKTSVDPSDKYNVDISPDKNDVYYLKLFTPALLLFITICFLCVAEVNNKSVIIEYYITSLVFISFCICFSICSDDKCGGVLWTILFIFGLVTMYHGSTIFSHVPKNVLYKATIKHITSTAEFSRPEFILQKNKFWMTNKNTTDELLLEFNKSILLSMITLFPTYPNKTTDQFTILIGLTPNNMTTVLKGPMPNTLTASSLETTISEEGILTNYLKFIGAPDIGCNMSCSVGLDSIEIYYLL